MSELVSVVLHLPFAQALLVMSVLLTAGNDAVPCPLHRHFYLSICDALPADWVKLRKLLL